MPFEHDKQTTLNRLVKDKSKKGSIDKPIVELIKNINKTKNFYTTSSCSGRILIIEFPKNPKKYDINWLLSSHEIVNGDDVLNAINQNTENEVWFKLEPFIFHIAVRDEDIASKVLKQLHSNGIRRAGIMNLKPRLILEIIGTQNVSFPLILDGKITVSKEELSRIVKKANSKLERNLDDLLKIKDVFI